MMPFIKSSCYLYLVIQWSSWLATCWLIDTLTSRNHFLCFSVIWQNVRVQIHPRHSCLWGYSLTCLCVCLDVHRLQQKVISIELTKRKLTLLKLKAIVRMTKVRTKKIKKREKKALALQQVARSNCHYNLDQSRIQTQDNRLVDLRLLVKGTQVDKDFWQTDLRSFCLYDDTNELLWLVICTFYNLNRTFRLK